MEDVSCQLYGEWCQLGFDSIPLMNVDRAMDLVVRSRMRIEVNIQNERGASKSFGYALIS